jgi:hypothetical protein
VDSEHENSKMNHFLQLGKSTFAGQNVLLRRKSSMMANSPNKPISNEIQKESPSSPQKIATSSSEKKHDASVLSKVLEENNNTNSAKPAVVASSSSASSSPYREPSKTAFTKSLLTAPSAAAASATSSSSSVNKMFPSVTSSSSASSAATKSNPVVEKPKKIDLMTPALIPAPVTTKEQVKPSAVVEIPVEKKEEQKEVKKLPSVTAVEIKPAMRQETLKKEEVIIPAVVKQEPVAVEMKLEITNMKESVENKEQSEQQRQNDVNKNKEPIVIALQSQASESLPTPAPAPAPSAPSSSPLRLLSTSNDEPTGEGEKGDKVQFFSLQSLAAPVSNTLCCFCFYFFLILLSDQRQTSGFRT